MRAQKNVTVPKNIYEMTDRELRIYKKRLARQIGVRRRCIMILMTICLIFICTVSYHSIKSSANTGNDELNFKYYTSIMVAYGDTLWELADEYIDYNEYKDKEAYIAEVKNINHLDADSDIKAGQYLIVPYYSNEFVR